MDPVKRLYEAMDADALDNARKHRKPPTRFRPSEAANCVRQIWFRLKGQRPAPRTATSNMYGIKGDAEHDITRQLFNHYSTPVLGVEYDEHQDSKELMAIRTEIPVTTPDGQVVKVVVSGRADGEMEIDGEKMLLEIKSTGFWPYDWLRKTYESAGMAGVLDRVKEKHKSWYMQCQIMMGLTGHKRCYLVVVDRSSGTIGLNNTVTGERSGIILDFDPEIWEAALQSFAYIKYKLSADEMPPAERAAKSADCSYCPFYYCCHGAAERRQKGKKPAILYPGPQMEVYNEGTAAKDHRPERPDAQREDDSGAVSD